MPQSKGKKGEKNESEAKQEKSKKAQEKTNAGGNKRKGQETRQRQETCTEKGWSGGVVGCPGGGAEGVEVIVVMLVQCSQTPRRRDCRLRSQQPRPSRLPTGK